jgi:hypothetical protein
MITETFNKQEVLADIDEAVSQLNNLIAPLDENKINTVPYEGSWTAAQLFEHVSQSINGMAKNMTVKTKPAERDPSEKIEGLKKRFLDFSSKMNSPEFIVPGNGPFKKSTVVDNMNKSLADLKESSNNANLTDLVENLPFGPTTKWELLHFVLYHTQRHLHQMEKICKAL